MNPRIFLSPPHMGTTEVEYVKDAFATNWISPVGPHVDAFESELAAMIGVPHAAALSSGTAGLHLSLDLLGVGPGDIVFCSTLTFVASANPILYVGAEPVFIDSEPRSWNMDPALLAQEMDAARARGRRIGAVLLVHVYGQCADLDPIVSACRRHGVPLIEDAAEALGARHGDSWAGSHGRTGVFSFNGNKILTTSGGGLLVSPDEALVKRARFLASQARETEAHYQHKVMGYNYRLSNVLAGIGRGQLTVLGDRVRSRRANFEFYRTALGDEPGISFMPEAAWGTSTRWLTVIQINETEFGASRDEVRLHLEGHNIESRPVWKPMHQQPMFDGRRVAGGHIAEGFFETGLCLPSGSQMSSNDLARVTERLLSTPRRPRGTR